MTENIISFIGVFLKHVIGVLLLCWRRMLRAGVVAFAIGVTLALLVAVIATGQAFPGALALVAALLFGAVLAYSVALTVLVEEFVLGVIDLMHLLEGDAKAVAHITETVTEREVGQVGQGLRRLIGLSVAAAARPPRPATPPSLPTLPKYPATPATAARPAHPATPARSTGVTSAALEAAAMAGAAALAARAARPSAAPTPAPAADAAPEPPEPPKGEPVRADMLPRIGWTYEHEAVKPTRSVTPAVEERPAVSSTDAAEAADAVAEPETLAALAGVDVVAATDATSATDGTSAASEEPASAQVEPLVAPAQEPAPTPTQELTTEPMDVAVVSATALGAHGPVAPTVMMDDAPPLEDERLAEPVALAVPDEETTPAVIVSAPAVEPALDLSLNPPLDPAMLTPAPSTTPLPQDNPPAPTQDEAPALDLAMLTPAPATTPLPPQEEPQPEPAAQAEEPITEEPVTEEPAASEGATVVATLAPLPAAPAAEAEPEASAASAASAATTEPEGAAMSPGGEPTDAPPPRSAFSRITRPVGGLEAAIDALGRAGVASGPRASTPESGLWERLSQALIDRSGAPSNPFSAPQSSRANTPDVTPGTASDAPASEPDETPQA